MKRPGPTVKVSLLAVGDDGGARRQDVVVAEEPLEIRVDHRGTEHPLTVTMRTPGNDFELAVGFLAGEGIIRGSEDLREVRYCVGGPAEQQFNIVTVALRDSVAFESRPRAFMTTSACGVCGKASLDEVSVKSPPPIPHGPRVDADLLRSLPATLRAAQKIFAKTGGVHAAGLFSPDGELIECREDVGRHNAVDKVVGALFLSGRVPAGEVVLQVSGRASYEIIQKAIMAGIPIVSAVGAPSSLAVALAEEFNVTLAGFTNGEGFNLYADSDRFELGVR